MVDCSAVLVSGVSKVSQSHLCTYARSLRFFPNRGCYRVLSCVPCAIPYVPVSYFIYSSVYTSIMISPVIPLHFLPPPNHACPVPVSLLSTSVTLSQFCNKFICNLF